MYLTSLMYWCEISPTPDTLWLRLKHEAHPLLRIVPQPFNVSQRSGFWAELKCRLRCRLKKLRKCREDLFERRTAKATAKKFKTRTAQRCRRQHDRLTRAFPNLNIPNPRTSFSQPFLRNRLEHSFRRLAPHIVEHNIHPRLGQLAPKSRDKRLLILTEGDDCIRTQILQFLEHRRIIACGNNSPRTETLGDLYRKLAGNSGCTKNQNALTRGKLRPRSQCGPRRHGRICDSRSSDVVDFFRQWQAHPTRRKRAFREAAEWAPRNAEIN